MESFVESSNGGSRLVVMDLSHIKQLLAQLEGHLGESPDLCKHLTAQIFSLTERSIAVINSSDFHGGRKRSVADAGLASSSVEPKITKKRKLDKMKNQVRVNTAGGGETPVDDGYSWRKYGQKEILGAKHPRSYYRCTHRHSQGCLATKQVQRTDEDPAIFDVYYIGAHTCVHNDKSLATQHNNPDDAHGPLQSLAATLAVKTEGLAAEEPQAGWSAAAATTQLCASSSMTPASVCLPPERSPFSALSMSPATSDSNQHVASFLAPQFGDAAEWRAHSELQEVVSALVVASTPPPVASAEDHATDDELLDFDIASFLA